MTPDSCHTNHYVFGMASPDAQGLDRMETYLTKLIDEDIFAAEEIEKMLAGLGPNPKELMVKNDRNAVEGRHLLQKKMEAENARAGSQAAE